MFLKFEDAELFVSSFGKGPPTLIAHGGWVGSGELWSQPFEILSRSWRTITYDHRGTGATINHAPAITFEILVQDLFKVLDALSVEPCVLASEPSGACIALEAALRDPSRFKGLVIVDGRYQGQIGWCSALYRRLQDRFPQDHGLVRQRLHPGGGMHRRTPLGQTNRQPLKRS